MGIVAFFEVFKDPIWVLRIEKLLSRVNGNYHWVPRLREIESLQVHTGYLTFSLKKTGNTVQSLRTNEHSELCCGCFFMRQTTIVTTSCMRISFTRSTDYQVGYRNGRHDVTIKTPRPRPQT